MFESCRKWRYDNNVEEFFVQTVDKVTVKRAELEALSKLEEVDPEQDS